MGVGRSACRGGCGAGRAGVRSRCTESASRTLSSRKSPQGRCRCHRPHPAQGCAAVTPTPAGTSVSGRSSRSGRRSAGFMGKPARAGAMRRRERSGPHLQRRTARRLQPGRPARQATGRASCRGLRVVPALAAPRSHSSALLERLARLGCTRIGSPGIFGELTVQALCMPAYPQVDHEAPLAGCRASFSRCLWRRGVPEGGLGRLRCPPDTLCARQHVLGAKRAYGSSARRSAASRCREDRRGREPRNGLLRATGAPAESQFDRRGPSSMRWRLSAVTPPAVGDACASAP